MAAIVGRPIPALNDMQNALQPPSRRNSIEIIDVDSYNGEASTSSQQSRAASRISNRRQHSHPETISLVDSDDEVEIVSSRIRSGHDVNGRRSHRHFISPPPRDPSAPPPMPPVPRHYAGFTSLPMRRQAPPFPSPPVLPNPEPFQFELSPGPPAGEGPSNHLATALGPSRTLPQRGAPPSHHTPSMGLGGALISSNRTQAIQQHAQRSAAATRIRRAAAARPVPRRTNPLNISGILNDSDDDIRPQIQMLLNGPPDDEWFYTAWTDFVHRGRATEKREREQYQQSYTHPPQPEPGFTFDFAVPSEEEDNNASRGRFFPPTSIHEPIILDDDEEEGSSSKPVAGPSSSGGRESSPGAGKLNALLVCAKCLDPLILNAGLDPEEAQYKRIWGLRCGHLIDEKCLNELGQPPEEDEQAPTTTADRKGKGKAKAAGHHKATYGDAVPELHALAVVEADAQNSIRSRLRSRLLPSTLPSQASSSNIPGGAGPSSGSGSVAAAVEMPTQHPPAKKRRVSNKKPKVEGEYEWKCPVASCGRVHVSVKIDGIWGPEKEKEQRQGAGKAGTWTEPRGAMAVFA
ncbi:hypothetical protein BDZ97DRAFT_1908295 [Flammula alnicola]|nr:hypothetical protein BDZ97DRAFT_1908295 [Flammula alnicola]